MFPSTVNRRRRDGFRTQVEVVGLGSGRAIQVFHPCGVGEMTTDVSEKVKTLSDLSAGDRRL